MRIPVEKEFLDKAKAEGMPLIRIQIDWRFVPQEKRPLKSHETCGYTSLEAAQHLYAIAMKDCECESAVSLLDRFVDLYGETPLNQSTAVSARQLWHDYWLWSGDHMVLTEDGWCPFEYLEDGVVVLDEVNEERGATNVSGRVVAN